MGRGKAKALFAKWQQVNWTNIYFVAFFSLIVMGEGGVVSMGSIIMGFEQSSTTKQTTALFKCLVPHCVVSLSLCKQNEFEVIAVGE